GPAATGLRGRAGGAAAAACPIKGRDVDRSGGSGLASRAYQAASGGGHDDLSKAWLTRPPSVSQSASDTASGRRPDACTAAEGRMSGAWRVPSGIAAMDIAALAVA